MAPEPSEAIDVGGEKESFSESGQIDRNAGPLLQAQNRLSTVFVA
jgi:hypothetical protein